MSTPIVHDTIRFERTLAQPPHVVFAAYADIDQRVIWSTPSDDEIVIFQSHDFAVGCVDHFTCGLKESPSLAGTTRYKHIVDDEVIVFSERLVTTAGDLLAMWRDLMTHWVRQSEVIDETSRLPRQDRCLDAPI